MWELERLSNDKHSYALPHFKSGKSGIQYVLLGENNVLLIHLLLYSLHIYIHKKGLFLTLSFIHNPCFVSAWILRKKENALWKDKDIH